MRRLLLTLVLFSVLVLALTGASTSEIPGDEALIKLSKEWHENKGMENGVITLPSGTQYRIVKKGPLQMLKRATLKDTVTFTYESKRVDGTVFDSSERRGGEPSTLPVKALLSGWKEVLQRVAPGDEVEVFLPYTTAYGPKGMPPAIGRYETLIFKLKLLGVNIEKFDASKALRELSPEELEEAQRMMRAKEASQKYQKKFEV